RARRGETPERGVAKRPSAERRNARERGGAKTPASAGSAESPWRSRPNGERKGPLCERTQESRVAPEGGSVAEPERTNSDAPARSRGGSVEVMEGSGSKNCGLRR